MTDIASKIIALREDVARAQRLRAEAEGSLALARSQVEQIESRLRELGISPENVDQELSDLESQLKLLAEQTQLEIETETRACQEIILKSKTAFGAK